MFSHLCVDFRALLQLAGYDYADIREHYYHSLFDADADRSGRIFLSGNLFGIGGGFYQNWLIESAYYLNRFPDDPRAAAEAPALR